jgi:serine/threonine-protein kinase
VPPVPRPASLPPHLAHWQLPPAWAWGPDSHREEYRDYQEVVDAFGRSLSLVTAPNPAHHEWLQAEARALAHRNHPAMPTTYHYWAEYRDSRRGPGYLRRWIVGETLTARVRRQGPQDVPSVLQLLRESSSAAAYLHDGGTVHGALSGRTVWLTPSRRLWVLGWQWVVPRDCIPPGMSPDPALVLPAPEWPRARWEPTPASDQWQLAAMAFLALTGEEPPTEDIPPVRLVRPDCPQGVADVLDRALHPDPARRFPSVAAMVRTLDRGIAFRATLIVPEGAELGPRSESAEDRVRWATGDDYEILSPLGAGTFGMVWRVRDLSLGREVALKMLHAHIARDTDAVARFRREAQLAAQLAHPAIVPIYDFDARGDVAWYTMELAEGGSVADLVRRSGARPLDEVLPQVDHVLDGLAAAHAVGVIHRDLKPENVLIDRYQHWRLTDFGIASALGEDVSGASGTPAFAPPEQLLGEAQGPMADTFALAAIVYFVLSGEPPFGDADGPAVLARQIQGDVTFEAFRPEVAEWLRRGLASDAEARFADASEMQAAWREVRAAVSRGDARGSWWRRVLHTEH